MKDTLIAHQKIFKKEVVPIVTTGFGDPVYLGPGHDEIDHLYITYHDGGDTEIFEDSVDEFVRKLRTNQSA